MTLLWEHRDLLVVLLYMLSMLVVAWRVSSKSRTVEGYTLGNRRIPGWAVGLSVLGTFLSSITFLGTPAKAFDGNWNVFVFALALPFAAAIAVFFFIPLYRTSGRLSAYELLEERLGYGARLYADISYIALQMIRIGTVMLLVSFALEPMFPWEKPDGWEDWSPQEWKTLKIVSILIGLGILIIVYDTIGGIQAVIWTDVIQVIVLVVGGIWCLAVLAGDWAEGPVAFFQSMPASKISLGNWHNWDAETGVWDWGMSSVLVVFLYGISENLRNYGTDQNYVQRMLTTETNREAAKSIWIGSLSYLPLSVLFCLIGTGLFVHYGGVAPNGLEPDQVFPHFIQTELPKPVAGLVIAAILAAAMSTVDSSLNSTSTILLVDVIRRLRKGPSRIPEILTIRLCTVTLGAIGTGTAVLLYLGFQNRATTIMDDWWKYAGIAGSGMFGLFLLAWLSPKTPQWGAMLGIVVSIPVLLWGALARDIAEDSSLKWLECTLHGNLVGIVGTVVLVAVGLLSRLAVKSER